MSKHPDLQTLIDSMTKAEKRYFKLNSARNSKDGDAQFIKLFDALDKNRILETKKGENRSVTASYLYGSILECLSSFHEKNSVDLRIDKLFRQGVILFNRGLSGQSLKMFLKAEAMAQQQQDFIRLQLIYYYIRALLIMKTEHSKPEMTLDHVRDQSLAAAKETELFARLRFVKDKFLQTITEAANLTDAMLSELKELLNSDIMHEVTEQSGFFAQLTLGQIWSQYYLLINDKEAGLKQGKKVFDLCYSHRELLKERGRILIAGANNYMMRCSRAGEHEEMKRVLDLIETERSRDISVETIRLETYYGNLLSYHITTKQFSSDELLSKVEKDLDEYGPRMNQLFLMFIYSLCSQYAFFRKDHHAAIKWINRFLNHENRTTFTKNLSIAFDYRLLIYYEQGKLDLIETLLRTKDGEEVGSNEFPIIRKALRGFLAEEVKDSAGTKEHLNALSLTLANLQESDLESVGFEFFPFDEWVAGKLKEVSENGLYGRIQ